MARTLFAPTVTFAALLLASALAAQAPPFRSGVEVKQRLEEQLQPTTDPSLEPIVGRIAEYVASYGASAALFVAAERYDQRVEVGPGTLRPHVLESEFAIVRTRDTIGWAAYRDVVEADGEQVADRRDRLQSLLTGSADPHAEVRQIADESARYNVGPVMRNFNLPTTTLFFFHPSRLGRFSFKSRGMKKVDGTPVQQLDFVEVARPTLVMKRDGTDVPVEGSVWVVPEDGTIVRTRVRLRGFADAVRMGTSGEPGAPGGQRGPVEYASPPPVQAPPPSPAPAAAPATGGGSGSGTASGSGTGSGAGSGQASGGQSGGTVVQSSPQAPAPQPMAAPSFPSIQRIDSRADVEVTYRRDPRFGVWLPAKMSEIYEGPIQRGTSAPLVGRATAVAQYSDYRRFETSATLVAPK